MERPCKQKYPVKKKRLLCKDDLKKDISDSIRSDNNDVRRYRKIHERKGNSRSGENNQEGFDGLSREILCTDQCGVQPFGALCKWQESLLGFVNIL